MKKQIELSIREVLQKEVSSLEDSPKFDSLEVPSDKRHGHFSSNIALKSARYFKKSPMQIAQYLVPKIEEQLEGYGQLGCVERIEVKNPGFINFFLSTDALSALLKSIIGEGDQYGKNDIGRGEKVQIEFVSANPTGPLSIAHARQAAVGDALGNILGFIGFDVTKEYYVNDGGNQINILGKSIYLRALQHFGEPVDFPEECYQGEYIADMAKIFIDQQGVSSCEEAQQIEEDAWRNFGCGYLLDVIKQELLDFHV
ncbi:MAG: arginine--tRNA ligase, partial [Candidatus Omnitrophica bacterium]|nr:arginine--tRNA ligase [Candidatus Omnitrophota bacterium]